MPDLSAYRSEVSPAAERDIQKLLYRIPRQDFDRLANAIDKLAEDPRPHGVRKIEGADTAYRIRVGSYRVVYDVYDSKKLVVILQVLRRSETTYKS
ncbi:MAG: type II toxin-antitoxin system RelE/ParE family toxin [Dehalococcoidia bacterium]|nr:type II toxin-antitoxin system RelE/ParE family toxin [Dehalococcoidia bacterium]MDD5495153.1 type II toxin-antitoxin system RelE/ParE family toxin [Dehalococcoidia bacterium]